MTLALTKLYLALSNIFLGIQVQDLTDSEGRGDTIMGGFLGVIASVARYAGIGLAAIGIYQFIHALQEGDGQGKGRAVLFIVAGAAMFLLKTLFTTIFANT